MKLKKRNFYRFSSAILLWSLTNSHDQKVRFTWLIGCRGFLRDRTPTSMFIPGTIGLMPYLSRHVGNVKAEVVASVNISCIGDEHAYSFLPSRAENAISK